MFTAQELTSIKSIRIDWSVAAASGVLVELKIGRWRARSKLEMFDLGLPDEAAGEMQELFAVGSRLLCPPELLKTLAALESQGRHNLEKHSYRTTFGLFVPETAYESFARDNREIEGLYMQAAQRIYDNLEQIKDQMCLRYDRLREQSYARLQEQRIPWTWEYHKTVWEQRIRDSLPSVADIAASYYWRTELSTIVVPETTNLVTRAGNADTVSLQNDLANSIGRKKDELDSFLATIKLQINQMISDTCSQVQQSIQAKAALHPRSVVQLKNMLSQIERLNFWDDAQVSAYVTSIQDQLDQSERNPVAISSTLEAIRICAAQDIAEANSILPPLVRSELNIQTSTVKPEADKLVKARQILHIEDQAPEAPTLTRTRRTSI